MHDWRDRVLSKVPEVTLVFWVLKIAATTLGETGGDSVTMTLLFLTSLTLPGGYLLSQVMRTKRAFKVPDRKRGAGSDAHSGDPRPAAFLRLSAVQGGEGGAHRAAMGGGGGCRHALWNSTSPGRRSASATLSAPANQKASGGEGDDTPALRKRLRARHA